MSVESWRRQHAKLSLSRGEKERERTEKKQARGSHHRIAAGERERGENTKRRLFCHKRMNDSPLHLLRLELLIPARVLRDLCAVTLDLFVMPASARACIGWGREGHSTAVTPFLHHPSFLEKVRTCIGSRGPPRPHRRQDCSDLSDSLRRMISFSRCLSVSYVYSVISRRARLAWGGDGFHRQKK